MTPYLNQHILMSTLKQAFFMQKYGAMEWNYDTRLGILSFNKTIRYKAQMIGTFANGDNTWLWSWANEQSNLPSEVTQYACKLKEWGIVKGVGEFKNGHFAVNEKCNPELIALLSIGLLKLPAFYAGKHQHGTVYLAVTDEKLFSIPKMNNMNFINHVTGIISQIPITSHKDAIIGFCNSLGWRGSLNGDHMTIINPNEKSLIDVTIDQYNRISGMKTVVSSQK